MTARELYTIASNAGTAVVFSGIDGTILHKLTDPAGTATAKTATFVTDGSDGLIKYTIEDDLIDAAGHWTVRGRVQGASTKLTSVVHTFKVTT